MISPVVRSVVQFFLSGRKKKIENQYFKYPIETQKGELKNLLDMAAGTIYGRQHRFDRIKTPYDYSKALPLSNYENLRPYIERMMDGEADVLWPGVVKWYAQSSGTTSTRSKFIPVSDEILERNHFQGGKDMLLFYLENVTDSKLLGGKSLKLGGTVRYDRQRDIHIGDLSGIMISRLPFWADFGSVPEEEIALIPDWTEKIQRIIEVSRKKDVRSLIGIPSWFQTLLTELLEQTGKQNIKEIWPGLEVFFHGGIHFDPYRAGFQRMLGNDVHYLEVYNASEGFFGIQNDLNRHDFLLMLDLATYFEFIPMEDFRGTDSTEVLRLDQVETGVNYAMVISNASGLWRYIIGDTIKFTSVEPYRFVITGRTKHFINLVGEEVIVDNTEKALRQASEKWHAAIRNYTVAPVFMEGKEKAAHEWMIEFEKPPADLKAFTEDLDDALRALNSDYDIKRTNDISLKMPVVHTARRGLFEDWLRKHGKLGGQHKVPRLSQTREIMEELLEMNV